MTRITPRIPARIAWAVALGCLIGCGSGDELERVPISGTVTLDGEPLPAGMIQFNPTSGDQPVISGGTIRDGRYAIARADGPVPGTYKVSINSSQEAQIDNDDELYGPGSVLDAPPDPIPSTYNTQTTLSAEVEAKGSNRFDYELKTRP